MIGELFMLGKSVNMFPIEISVQDFMSTHSLIIGQTRSGKSHLTRLLIEQTHGKCSQFVFDREGEYVTLRERFDFVVIGEGWDFKASPAIAAELAVRLLRLGASAVIDLSSMKHKDDLEFVRGFIDGLMSLKLDEQREAMLVFDEVHLLAPEGKETACGNEIMNIAKRGLKRGMFAVFTTQRLPEVAKGVVLQSNNYFSGRVVDIDAARTAGRLRLNKSQVNMLQSLHRGEFFVAGPAIQGADNALLVTINDTITHAPNRRNWKDFRLAPAKGAVLAALGELKDVEQEVTEKAQSIEKLRERIRELEACSQTEPAELSELREENERLRVQLGAQNARQLFMSQQIGNAVERISEVATSLKSTLKEEEEAAMESMATTRQITKPRPIEPVTGCGTVSGSLIVSAHRKVDLPQGAARMLAYAASRYPHSVTRGAMVAYARISSKSSNVGKFLKLLTDGGYLELKAYGYAATELGCNILPDHEPLPDDPASKLQAWKSRLAPGAVRMLDAIHRHRKLDRERVLDIAGVSQTSSNASKFFKQLQEYGLIVIEDGYCQMHKDYQ